MSETGSTHKGAASGRDCERMKQHNVNIHSRNYRGVKLMFTGIRYVYLCFLREIKLVRLIPIVKWQLFPFLNVLTRVECHPPLSSHVEGTVQSEIACGWPGVVDQSSETVEVSGGIQAQPLAIWKVYFKYIASLFIDHIFIFMWSTFLPAIWQGVLVLTHKLIFRNAFPSNNSQALPLNLHHLQQLGSVGLQSLSPRSVKINIKDLQLL